jgi:hypothetical protein
MTFRASYPSFAGGEVSEAVAARWDVAKYTTALSLARNTLGLAQGGQYNRPGFLLCDTVKDSADPAIVMPFVFATGNAYALEFTPNLMRVYYRGQLVTRPKLTITGITKAAQALVTVPSHGYEVGQIVVFDGVEGMTEINGLRGEVLSVTTDTITVSIDSTGFSTFTGDTGGVAGDAGGGSGGYPPPPPPGEDPPPPPLPDSPEPPPRTPPAGGLEPEVNPDI